MLRKLRKFFKTPKGLVTIILTLFAVISAPAQGGFRALTGLLIAILAAGSLDILILRFIRKGWEFPSGAVLTAMIVGMVLRTQEPLSVTVITSVIAVLSKYCFRVNGVNVFNPAAFALVLSFYLFHTGQNWWGAMVDVRAIGKILLLGAGIFIADRVNKMPLVLSFLGAYFMLFTITAFAGDALSVAEIYRTPDLEALLFFTFIILTDPPTSPAKYPDQKIYGLIVALVSYAFFECWGVVYYLLAGVLVANIWESWRRARRRAISQKQRATRMSSLPLSAPPTQPR